jgi:hypothetical protein
MPFVFVMLFFSALSDAWGGGSVADGGTTTLFAGLGVAPLVIIGALIHFVLRRSKRADRQELLHASQIESSVGLTLNEKAITYTLTSNGPLTTGQLSAATKLSNEEVMLAVKSLIERRVVSQHISQEGTTFSI